MNFANLPTLTRNTKSVVLQLSSGSIGYAEIPNTVSKVGVITTNGGIRVALNTVPSSASTVIGGSALAATFQSGYPLSSASEIGVNWLDIGTGVNRVLYFKGITSLPQVTILYV